MLRKLLMVAHFDDVDSMHKARLLNSISLLLAVIMGVLLVVTLFTPILAVRWPLAAALLMVCGIQVLLRQKKLNAASWLLIAVIWTLIAQDVLLFSGMRGRYFGMFTVVIFLAFVLLPNRNWWFVVIASCVVGVLAVLFEQSLGLTFGTGQQDSLLEAFLTEMGGLIVSVLLFTITYRQKSRLLAEAEVTNAELARSVEALGLGEARFRSLIQNAAEAIIVVDIEKRNIVDANQRAVELFGYSRDELLAFAPLLIETANQSETNDGVDFLTTLAERVMAGETVIFERTYLHADGYKLIAEARFTRLPSEHGS